MGAEMLANICWNVVVVFLKRNVSKACHSPDNPLRYLRFVDSQWSKSKVIGNQ